MKLKKFISSFLAFTFAVSLVNAVPQTVLASTETVSQTVFELDIEDILGGNIPDGITLNTDILDDTASSASAGLISDVVSAETEFLAIDLETAESDLEGTGTGIYTVEFVLNAIDGDTTANTKNGNIIYVNGENTASYMIVRSRESTDFTVLRNAWNGTEYKAVSTVETAHYTMTGLNASTGAATSHTAKYNGSSYLFGGVAHDSALPTWTGAPITGFTIKAANGYRANIKSIKITRLADVEAEPETVEITVSSEDDEKGTVDVDGINAENLAVVGADVTLTAIPESGYAFDGWYKDGDDEAISLDEEYVFEASGDTAGSYVAKFRRVVTVEQKVFELNVANILNGNLPDGVTINDDILDSTNSSNDNGLISTVVSANTDFLTIDFEEAVADLSGEDTGIYTIALVTNVNDSNSSNKNGTMMYLEGVSKHLVFRARESSDFCVMPNSWAALHWQTNTGATASYGIENLNIYDGSADAHYAMRGSSPQYSAYANGHALAAGNANEENPINVLTLSAPNGYRANIKSLVIARQAIVPSETYNIGAESEDEDMGSVRVSDTSVESGENVTLKAFPEDGCVFDGWYDADTDELVSSETEWTFFPVESKNYIAKFIYAETFDITAESADPDKGSVTVSPEAPYFEGDEVTLKATANSGYVFDGWYVAGEKVSGAGTYTVVASGETEGNYIAKFISAAFEEQPVYTFDVEEILGGEGELPEGITLNEDVLDDTASSGNGALIGEVKSGAETFMTINLADLVEGLELEGLDSGVYKVEIAVNVKDEDEAINGTDLFAVNNGGAKQLLTASESSGVKASKGDGMNGGGDSYKRTFVTYAFELNVKDGTLTSMLTDQTGSNIFSSVANGQTVTVPGINSNDPITELVIKNIAGQRANVISLDISRNIALVDYGNDTPIFNETCVKLLDVNGNVISGNRVTAAIKTIAIDFRSVLLEETVTIDTVYIEKDGEKLEVEPVHNDGIVTFDVSGLEPEETYTVCVTSDVKNTNGVAVRSADEYSFSTKAGKVIAEIADIADIDGIEEGDEIGVTVDYVNTNLDEKDLYVVYVAYRGNELCDVKIAEYNDIEYTIDTTFEPSFTAGDMTDVTAVRVFAFDSWDDMNLLDDVVIGEIDYENTADATSVSVDNGENKIIISGIADANDEILIEVIDGNGEHLAVFEGIEKTEDVYGEDVPVSFFDKTKGSFKVDVSLAESGDYTVYVKNITDDEILIDGEVITFTDSDTYASLINGLDTENAEAFAASLTDDVATQLGFDILVGETLGEDKAEAIALIYEEGLSDTDAEANRKLVAECVLMTVINNNSVVDRDKALAVANTMSEIVESDSTLKKWYNKYITDDESKIALVKKLLATEAESSGADKVEEIEDVTDAVKVALVLVIAKAPNGHTNIKDSFSDFKSSFGRTSVSSKNSVYKKLIGDYDSKSDFLDKYDDEVDNSGGGGGNGGSPDNDFVINPTDSKKDPAQTVPTLPPQTPMEKNIFNDLASVPWAEKAIVTLRVKGVVSGKTETEFCPGDNITREEFVTLIVNAFAKDAEVIEPVFEDVASDAWYYEFIQKAKASGLVSGVSENQFGVGANITRQDMAVIIYNAAKLKNVVGNNEPENFPFADDAEISDYAKEAVYTLKTMGIVNGIDSDNFAPKATATRAEAAMMIYNLLLK